MVVQICLPLFLVDQSVFIVFFKLSRSLKNTNPESAYRNGVFLYRAASRVISHTPNPYGGKFGKLSRVVVVAMDAFSNLESNAWLWWCGSRLS